MKIPNLDTVKHIKAAKMSGRNSMARGCTRKVYAKAESGTGEEGGGGVRRTNKPDSRAL